MTPTRTALATMAALALLSSCGGGSTDTAGETSGDSPSASSSGFPTPSSPTASESAGSSAGGFAEMSVDEITTAAKDAMTGLTSVRLSGDLISGGQPIMLDLGLSSTGDCQGSIGIMGGNADIVSKGGTSWFKPDAAFWKASSPSNADAIIAAVGDKWVILPKGDKSFTSFCDLDSFLSDLNSGKNNKADNIAVDGTEQLDGTDTVRLTGEENGGTVTANVAVDDPHYILQFKQEGGTDNGTLTFSDFDQTLDITPPADSEVTDLGNAG